MKRLFGVLVSVCLVLSAYGARGNATVTTVTDAPGSKGHNFLITQFATFQMNKTTPDIVKAALVGQPFDTGTTVRINYSSNKKLEGRTATLFGYGYSENNSCYPQKWADFSFVNERLEAYHFFSVLVTETPVVPNPQKVAAFQPGKTRRADVLQALGTPNYWSTGMSLTEDKPEEIGYYWIASSSPSISLKRLLITFDSTGVVKTQPVIDSKLNDTSMFRWLCKYPPPRP